MIECGVTFDLSQLVMDNEIAKMIRLYVAGVPVNDEALAVDAIVACGPFGDYLSSDHTMRHMREASQPKLIDRRVRAEWADRGSQDMAAVARVEAKRILAEHQPTLLPDDVLAELAAIVARAEAAVPVAAH